MSDDMADVDEPDMPPISVPRLGLIGALVPPVPIDEPDVPPISVPRLRFVGAVAPPVPIGAVTLPPVVSPADADLLGEMGVCAKAPTEKVQATSAAISLFMEISLYK